MNWLRSHLTTAQEWAALLVGAPVAVWGLLVGVSKLIKLLRTMYEGGSFLMDVKEHLESMRGEMKEGFAKIDRGQLYMIQSRRLLFDRELSSAFFECDATGHYLWVSRLWKRITGMDSDDAAFNGWELAIAPSERVQVIEAWRMSIEKQRPFEQVVTFIDREGHTTPMKMFASPIKDDDTGAVIAWFGHLIK